MKLSCLWHSCQVEGIFGHYMRSSCRNFFLSLTGQNRTMFFGSVVKKYQRSLVTPSACICCHVIDAESGDLPSDFQQHCLVSLVWKFGCQLLSSCCYDPRALSVSSRACSWCWTKTWLDIDIIVPWMFRSSDSESRMFICFHLSCGLPFDPVSFETSAGIWSDHASFSRGQNEQQFASQRARTSAWRPASRRLCAQEMPQMRAAWHEGWGWAGHVSPWISQANAVSQVRFGLTVAIFRFKFNYIDGWGERISCRVYSHFFEGF